MTTELGTLTDAGENPGLVEATLLNRIGAIAREVRNGDSLEATLRELGSAVVETTPWPMCGVELFDVDHNRLLAWTSAGFDAAAVEVLTQWHWEGDPSVTAARRNQVLTVPDVLEADAFPKTRSEAVRSGFRSAVYVPVRLDRCWAVASFCRPDRHDYTTAELALAVSLTSFVAIAVECAMNRPSRRELGGDAADGRERTAQHRATAHERLLRLQSRDATMTELCGGVADVLHLPVMFLDRFRQPLATAGLSTGDAADLLDDITRCKPVPEGDPAPPTVRRGRFTVVTADAYDRREHIASLVVVMPIGERADPDLEGLIDVAREHLALAVIRRRAGFETEIRMRQGFGEALGSMAGGGLALSQYASMLGIELAVPQRVMRVHPEGMDRPLSSHDAYEVSNLLTRRLADIGVSAVVSPVGGVDFVVAIRDQQRVRAATRPEIAVRSGLKDALTLLRGSAATTVRIAIGTGNSGTGVDGLDRSHREAKRALEVARFLDGDDGERDIADAGSYRLLAASSMDSLTDQELFVRRYLQPLLDYDRIHGAGLVETLAAYFENVGNVQRTANKLFLHLSTVRYRIKRIEEIAQIDLREEEDRLCMQLALRIKRFAADPRPSIA
ncbi:helix-turn-helix domain-containing protein [Gordonia sp. LSe1-13]|uniref:Helix-turn-helix domain-containing protein n=1 Tax=Gordonia sesuvii TaxID=3116777 RepID=A0ABU7MIT8_9ACTN|nr:helix-turn-helix domain-containing protein [Gordonia sp. LSe1-13]